jgi:hypothetical protein
MSKADFDDAIADVKKAAFSKQGLKGLRSIRALLIDVTFRQELQEIIARSHNQPEERAAIVAALAEVKFAFSDQRAERSEQHSQTGLVAIGGGVALSEVRFWQSQPKFWPSLGSQLCLWPSVLILVGKELRPTNAWRWKYPH